MRIHKKLKFVLFLTFGAIQPVTGVASDNNSGGANTMRDPEIAVVEEFDAAKEKATVAGWELFIARHPEHALAVMAQKELEALRK